MDEFKKILNSGFHRHKLPDIKVVQTKQLKSGDSLNNNDLVIHASKNKKGLVKWTWNFCASDMDYFEYDDDNDNCILEFIGSVLYVQCETVAKTLDSHVIQYKMKSTITVYGDDCYTDCRPSEMEAAEEHVQGELEYDLSGEKVIGYDLTDLGDINKHAIQKANALFHRSFGVDSFDIQTLQHGEKSLVQHHDTPVIIKCTDKDGFQIWSWSFTTEEEEYGCTLRCEGSINIVSKTSPNPKFPTASKKRRRLIAPPRQHTMRTKILNIE